jgi:hypothetical protein
MVIDGDTAKPSQWASLGGKLWLGDVSPNASGRRVQDVKIEGIPIENARTAIRVVRCRQKRALSAEEREACLVRLRK